MPDKEIMTERSSLKQIPIRHVGNEEKKYNIINKSLNKEIRRQKKLIEELEYRLTLLSSIYQVEPPESKRSNARMDEEQKDINEVQLGLLMFALQNTELEEEDIEAIKVTITKRCEGFSRQ